MQRKLSLLHGLLLVLAVLMPVAGCTGPMLMGAYLMGAADTPAKFDKLKKSKVVVVCRPNDQFEYASKRPAEELARAISLALDENVRRCEIVPQRRVQAWIDEHDWEDYAEIGKAMEADYVVAIDLDLFRLYESQTLFRGQAEFLVQVYDMEKGGEIVFEEETPDTFLYPPTVGVSTADKTEAEFRRLFVGMVARRISTLFYNYDHRDDFAKDSTAL